MNLDVLWQAPLLAVAAVTLLTVGVVIGWLANETASRLRAETLARRISDRDALDAVKRWGQ